MARHEDPKDPRAEALLLDAAMRGGRGVRMDIGEKLHPDMFYRYENLARVILDLIDKEQKPDAETVLSMIDADEFPDHLKNVRGTPTNATGERGYIERVRRAYQASELLVYYNEAAEHLLDMKDPEQVREQVRSREVDLNRILDSGGSVHVGDAAAEAERELEQRALGEVAGIPSRFDNVNDLVGGYEQGDAHIIGGRTSQGKTAFALTEALHFSVEEQEPGVIFSIEMGARKLGTRLLGMDARVNTHMGVDPSHQSAIRESQQRLAEAPFWIDDTPGLDMRRLRSRIRRMRHDRGIRYVIVDYLQLLSPAPGVDYEKKSDRMTALVRDLVKTAQEQDVAVLVLSQLNRRVDHRSWQRPRLSDLREGGEEPADVTMSIWRPEEYGHTQDQNGRNVEGMGEIPVLKNRNGPTGSAWLTFLEEYARWVPATQADEPEGDDDLPF